VYEIKDGVLVDRAAYEDLEKRKQSAEWQILKVILYIGLPKTATTFLQTKVFPHLSDDEILYNPLFLTEKVESLIRQGSAISAEQVLFFHQAVRQLARESRCKTLLLVNEHMGYWGWNPDPEEGSRRIKMLFPDAIIIVSFRYQTDWLLSLYRHYMDIGGCDGIESFLGFDGFAFDVGGGMDNLSDVFFDPTENGVNAVVRIDIHRLDWGRYLKCFVERFGRNNIHVIFFENFLHDKSSYTEQLLKIIGGKLERKINFGDQSNRGRSALGCKITMLYCSFRSYVGIRPRSLRRWNRLILDLKVDRKRIGGLQYWLTIVYLVARYGTFQFLMTQLEKLVFVDWDMLARGGMRVKLDRVFKERNKKLLEYVSWEEITRKYLG
jgi:hypothetical protein